MQNPIKLIHKFNEEAGLIKLGYDDFRESSFQIEEALEGLPLTTELWFYLNPETELEAQDTSVKTIARQIVNTAMTANPSLDERTLPVNWDGVSDVDRLDKACDAVVFAVGSMAKLGLNPQQITEALNVVMNANMAKLNCPKDEHGKLTKPADFDEKYAPEPKLQAILDKRV